MRSRTPLVRYLCAQPYSADGRTRTVGGADSPKGARRGAPAALRLALLGLSLLAGGAPSQAQSDPANPTPQTLRPASVSVVDFKQLSEQPQARRAATDEPERVQEIRSPGTIQESPAAGAAGETFTSAAAAPSDTIGGPNVPSPSPSTNYLAQEDSAKVGTLTFTIPPDTMGAVGPDKVFVNLNNNYRVQNKLTGVPLSTVSIDTFWASTGATGVFDPRVQYDPYNQRWIVSAVSNAQTANSSVLLGISATSDPQGTYTLFRFIVGCAAGAAGCNAQGEWADYPMLGFNKNWIAIGWNQFTINTGAFVGGKMAVFDYPAARTGTAAGTLFTNASAATGFCMHPATTFSATESTLYVPIHQQSAGALYRLHKITGTAAAPVFTLDTTARVRPGGGWTQPGGDNLPQQCVPGVGLPTQTCPASPRGLEASDSFIRSNAVFRNGKIWYPQSIALPAGGLTVNSRFAVQWTALNPDGSFFDGGRVQDAAAQIFNGGKHYSYPSISVNKNNDVLFGFSEFESDDYVDAGYTFRVGTDAAGTMRDPVIYKEGEDYYQKTFSDTRNRWGDYSHTVVDPSNDRDLWTIQEYAQLRVGVTGQGSNDSRWGTWWAKVTAPAGPGDLVISEFRLRGPGGAEDEFVEILNPTNSPLTVTTTDGSAGYALAASDGAVRFTIPSGTTIPARGHYLGVNSDAYSLSSYPAGTATTASGDATYTDNIPDNGTGEGGLYRGIALFNTANTANFSTTTRLDAVGPTSEANTLYREGAGHTPLSPNFNTEHAWVRDHCGKGGNMATFGPCPSNGAAVDNNDNAADFFIVDTAGLSTGAGQRLGAPGPENLSSPARRDEGFSDFLLDQTQGASAAPNRVRNSTPGPSPTLLGTLELRRRIVNNTGGIVTRLRFRVIDTTTFPTVAGRADVRALTSTDLLVGPVNDSATCVALQVPPSTSPIPPCTVTVRGLTLETPPAQPNGGGFNASLSADSVTITPLAPGQSINLRFLLGVQAGGGYRFLVIIEALP